MLVLNKYELRAYVSKRVDKRMNDKYVDVVRRMAEGDAATQAVLTRHREKLDDQLGRTASVLLQDATVRANLLGALQRDNEARLQRMEERYRWDVRVAQCMAGAASLTLLAMIGYAAATTERRA
jgi:hypothetical protein